MKIITLRRDSRLDRVTGEPLTTNFFCKSVGKAKIPYERKQMCGWSPKTLALFEEGLHKLRDEGANPSGAFGLVLSISFLK
jgi:hypothetical protein